MVGLDDYQGQTGQDELGEEVVGSEQVHRADLSFQDNPWRCGQIYDKSNTLLLQVIFSGMLTDFEQKG